MTDLILLPPAALPAVEFKDAAKIARESALESASLIGVVRNAEQNALAVGCQVQLRELIAEVEKARKAAKEPILNAGRALDDACKEFVAPLKAEELRVAKIVGDFQQAEIAKVQASQNATNARLTELEREREAAIAAASSAEEIEMIREDFNERIRALQPVNAPTRAEGQSVRAELKVEVTDDWALLRWVIANGRVDFVLKFDWSKRVIKETIEAGITLPGVKSEREVKATVRLPRKDVALDQ